MAVEKMFPTSRSKTGLPVICESGGGSTNTGFAQIICAADGSSVKPLFVPKGYCNDVHAMFVARPGMFLVRHSYGRDFETTIIWEITKILPDEVLAVEKYCWENGDGNIPVFLKDATEAAKNKAHDYHCRSPYYISK